MVIEEKTMRNPWVVMLVATLAAGAVGGGCGGGSGLGVYEGTVSCTVSEPIGTGLPLQVCEEITGATAAQAEQEVQQCSGMVSSPDAGVSGSVHAGYEPCSREHALGGCKVVEGTESVTAWYYDDGTGLQTSADVQTVCSGVGATFVAP